MAESEPRRGPTRGSAEWPIIERALTDADFRARLLAEPKETIASEIEGLPEWLSVQVIEESPEELIIVLPSFRGGEVDDAELLGASGAWDGKGTGNPFSIYC